MRKKKPTNYEPLNRFEPNEETLRAIREADEGRLERTSITGILERIEENRAEAEHSPDSN